jgi:hypothetical protein
MTEKEAGHEICIKLIDNIFQTIKIFTSNLRHYIGSVMISSGYFNPQSGEHVAQL